MTTTRSAASARPARYGRHTGRNAALTTVVTVRSYSRISGDTSYDAHTSWPRARSSVRDRGLVLGVQVAVDEADRDGIGAFRHRRRGSLHVADQHRAVGRESLGELEASIAIDEWRGAVHVRVVEARTVLAADLDDIGEARRRVQRDGRDVAFEQRVGGDGRAVREELDTARGERGGTGAHGESRIASRGRELDDAPVGAHDVGERPTAVGSDPHPRTVATTPPAGGPTLARPMRPRRPVPAPSVPRPFAQWPPTGKRRLDNCASGHTMRRWPGRSRWQWDCP